MFSRLKLAEAFSQRIEDADPTCSCGDPQTTFIIQQQVVNTVAAQTLGITRLMLESGKPIAIIATKAILCAKPHEAGAVLDNGRYPIMSQPIGR